MDFSKGFGWWNSLNANFQYLIKFVIIIILVLVVNAIIKWTLRFFEKETKKTKTPWDSLVLRALSLPARLLVWVGGLGYAAYTLLLLVGAPNQIAVLILALKLGVLGCGVLFAFRFIKQSEAHFVTRLREQSSGDIPLDENSIQAMSKLVQVVVVLMAALTVLGILEIPISGLITFGGISSIGVLYAGKDMLANFFGGFVVYFDRHFAVGDWIYSPNEQLEGTVEYIGWRLTRIRSFDQRPIYVPNNIFTKIIIINASRMNNRRILQNVNVRYQDADKMPDILASIRKMLKEHPEIDQRRTTLVNLVGLQASSITFMVYTFTKTVNWSRYQNVQDDVMLKIEKIIREHGAECAFPTTTLHVPERVLVEQATLSEERPAELNS